MYSHWTGDCHPIIENGTTDVKYRLRFGDRVTTSVFRRTASQKVYDSYTSQRPTCADEHKNYCPTKLLAKIVPDERRLSTDIN